MIDHLLRLPYITYWLPVVAAIAAAAPLIWYLRSPRTAVAVAAGAVPPDPAIPGASSEQRRSFRRGGNTIEIHYAPPGQHNHPALASLMDRSLGGLCLETHEAVPVGTVIAVRPAHADEIVPWVEVEVCVCRPNDNSFEVGCRFVKTPPYSILLLFG
jgi:PilZ domain